MVKTREMQMESEILGISYLKEQLTENESDVTSTYNLLLKVLIEKKENEALLRACRYFAKNELKEEELINYIKQLLTQ